MMASMREEDDFSFAILAIGGLALFGFICILVGGDVWAALLFAFMVIVSALLAGNEK
jgi:hypothetical protein